MIYKISGSLIAKEGGRVAVDVGGIAYEIMLSMSSYSYMPALNEKVELYTHLAVREDGFFLYGFTTIAEKEAFLKLISVSKIGPKIALSILGNIGVSDLASAVAAGDVDRLSKVPGIGKKSAERLIVELKDKLGDACTATSSGTVSAPYNVRNDVVSALVNLGYKESSAQVAVSSLTDIQDADFETILRKALSKM